MTSPLAILHILPSTLFSYLIGIAIELVGIGICVFLWKRGQYRDRLARNPFHGILDIQPVRSL